MRRPIPLVLAGALLSHPAAAYELQTTGEGVPIRWARGSIGVDLELGGGPDGIAAASAEHAATAGFAPWTERLEETLAVHLARRAEEGAEDARRSAVHWVSEDWERDFSPDALAVTVVTYRVGSGEITAADVNVNAAGYRWTTAGAGDARCRGLYDLQSVIAHEAGHFFGLGHSGERDATMYPETAACRTQKRTLSADDLAGLAALYDAAIPDPAGTGGDPDGGAGDAPPPPAPEAYGCGAEATVAPGAGLGGALWVLLLCAGLSRLRSGRLSGDALPSLRRAAGGLFRRRRSLWVAASALVLAAVLPIASARAGVARELSVDELSTRAVAVIRGRVLDRQSLLVDGWIYTDSRVRVTECWKGPCPEVATVRQLGGEVGDLGMKVSGQAALRSGDRVVLFLRERPDGALAPIGMAQGAFFELAGEGGPILVRDLGGLSLLGGVDVHSRSAEGGWSAGALRREVSRSVP